MLAKPYDPTGERLSTRESLVVLVAYVACAGVSRSLDTVRQPLHAKLPFAKKWT